MVVAVRPGGGGDDGGSIGPINSLTLDGRGGFGLCARRVLDIVLPYRPRALSSPVRRSAREVEADRGRLKPSRAWYNTRAWQRRRAEQLAAAPICRFHWERMGEVVEATVADHVEPHREDYDLFWFGALQSLCATCHSSIKQREERAKG